MWFCEKCGNKERFEATQSYKTYGSRTVYLDGDGEEIDTGDYYDDDSDFDSPDNVVCIECQEPASWYDTVEELEEAKRLFNNNKKINWEQRISGEKNETCRENRENTL